LNIRHWGLTVVLGGGLEQSNSLAPALITRRR